ncbi:hypothetical protein QVD17_41651 [Tagetes erecta]|uniref:Uncharacterized protein n=1 Tax=Tagetes erecta TaxID=13708 RepID=A0AAD8JKV2_TARER|nr:hypothetical protein QVD17_41651 [Tagetes erecta]
MSSGMFDLFHNINQVSVCYGTCEIMSLNKKPFNRELSVHVQVSSGNFKEFLEGLSVVNSSTTEISVLVVDDGLALTDGFMNVRAMVDEKHDSNSDMHEESLTNLKIVTTINNLKFKFEKMMIEKSKNLDKGNGMLIARELQEKVNIKYMVKELNLNFEILNSKEIVACSKISSRSRIITWDKFLLKMGSYGVALFEQVNLVLHKRRSNVPFDHGGFG